MHIVYDDEHFRYNLKQILFKYMVYNDEYTHYNLEKHPHHMLHVMMNACILIPRIIITTTSFLVIKQNLEVLLLIYMI